MAGIMQAYDAAVARATVALQQAGQSACIYFDSAEQAWCAVAEIGGEIIRGAARLDEQMPHASEQRSQTKAWECLIENLIRYFRLEKIGQKDCCSLDIRWEHFGERYDPGPERQPEQAIYRVTVLIAGGVFRAHGSTADNAWGALLTQVVEHYHLGGRSSGNA